MELQPVSANTVPHPPVATPAKAAPAAAEQRASAPPAAAPKEAPEPSAEQLAQAVKNINRALQGRAQDLEFSVDSDSARLIVKVTDKTTHEVIRQMPSKEALEIAKAIDHLQSLLIRQTA